MKSTKTKPSEVPKSKGKSVKIAPKPATPLEKPVTAKTSTKNIEVQKRPLSEPKSRVELPPRVKTKVQRWPIINLPPLKRKPWDWTKVCQSPKPKPKVIVNLPPLKRKPWVPPEPPKVPPKPKIEYPPLKMRTKRKEPKKPKQRPKLLRYEKTQFPNKDSTLDKAWNHFKCRGDKFILHGNLSVNHKRFNDLSLRLTPATSIVCLIYSKLYPISKWTNMDLDKILNVGSLLYKESLSSLRHKQGTRELKPNQINSVIYVDLQKISVNVGKILNKVCLDLDKPDQMENGLKEMLTTFKHCILSYGEKNYAIWEDGNAFYTFISEDTDENGTLVKTNQGQSCIVRCTNMAFFMDFLKDLLRQSPEMIECRLYSFELLKVTIMKQHPDKSLLRQLLEAQTKETKRPLTKETVSAVSNESIQQPPKDETSFEDKLISHFNPVTLTKDYKKLSDTHGILRSTMIYNSSSSKTSSLVLACILMLNKHRATTWTRQTLQEIFSLGDSILKDNEIPESSTTVTITDLKTIRFDNQIYSVNTENFLFGQIESSSLNVTDLSDGIKTFLGSNDIGVIHGPQIIPFWQESGLYFMFDPKERDEEGRKYHQTARISDTPHGSSCVLWFKHLQELVEMYKRNIPPKHARDLFKIIKVETKPCNNQIRDWNSWKMIMTDKWIVRGSFDETSDRFEKDNRGKQGVCMAATAIAYTKMINLSKWNTRVIDKILKTGDKIYTINIYKLKSRKKYVSPLLTVDELNKQIKIQDELVNLNISQSMINGSLMAQEDEKNATLYQALTRFFEDGDSGILIACQIATAVFKDVDCYYLFDPHARDEEGGNLDAKVAKTSRNGLACALRFTSIKSMSNSLMNTFCIKDSPEFSIIKIEPTIPSNSDKVKPNFHNYSDFLNYRFAGILRATSYLHQNSNIFPVKSPKKTYINLLSALVMNEMIPSIHWTGKEIVEILRFGYDLMLKLPSDKVVKDVTFGNNQFKIEDQVVQCVFFIDERIAEEEVAEKVIELNTSTGDEAQQEQQTTEPREEEEEDTSSPVQTESSKELTLTITMENQIKILSSKDIARVIVESNLFSLAIWKQDGLYYVYDPNETLSDGSFTRNRLEMIQKLVEEARKATNIRQIRKKQVVTSEGIEMEVIDEELVKYTVPEANLSIMHLPMPTSSHDIRMKCFGKKQDDKGLGASVIVFSNEKVLLKHLLANVPEDNRYDEFSWHSLEIRNELRMKEPSPKWNHFTSHKPKQWILRGSTSQKDDRFNYDNSQDICNSMVALAIASNIPTSKWTSEMIDVALKYGIRLYSSSLYQVRKSDPRLMMTTRLNIDQMINSFVISKTKFGFKVELYGLPETFTVQLENETKDPVKSENTDKAKPLPTFDNLNIYLKEFFLNNTFGLLLAKKYAVAVFMDEDQHFYIFDPHTTGPDGIRKTYGVSSLSRYVSVEDLSLTYLSSTEQLETGPNTFELYKIEIDSKQLEQNKPKKEEITKDKAK